ncbi:MAG: hypothetical protein ACI4SH_02820 [Candidatus Scatosoma sp.]
MQKTKKKKKKKKLWQKALIALISIALAAGIVLLCAIGYFRLPVSAYYKASEKAFVIPGTSEGFIAQGIAYDEREDTFFVSGYMKDKSASPLYLVNKSGGKTYKTLYLQEPSGEKHNGHCGGVAVHGDYIYVAGGSQRCLYVYSYQDAVAAENGEGLACRGTFSLSAGENDYLGAAFVTVWDNALVTGEFYREGNYPTLPSHKRTAACGDYNQAIALCFPFADEGADEGAEGSAAEGGEETAFGLKTKPSAAISMPGLVQGAYFEDGKAVLSTSYGAAFSHLYEYDLKKAETQESIALLGAGVPLFSLDSDSLLRKVKIPPMSEEIVLVGGKTYVMCESASDKYVFGKLTGGKWCYATDLSKM